MTQKKLFGTRELEEETWELSRMESLVQAALGGQAPQITNPFLGATSWQMEKLCFVPPALALGNSVQHLHSGRWGGMERLVTPKWKSKTSLAGWVLPSPPLHAFLFYSFPCLSHRTRVGSLCDPLHIRSAMFKWCWG